MKYLLIVCLVVVSGLALQAHHDHHDIHIRSVTCGWLEGDDLRDIRNLSDFCTRSVPAGLRISSAAATKELLWIEAPSDLASTLRANDDATEAVLREWLARWRTVTGYRTASVIIMRRHVEVAKVQTTMAGDAISIR